MKAIINIFIILTLPILIKPQSPGHVNIVLPVNNIYTPTSWNTIYCLEDPDNSSLYDGAFNDKDVNDLRTIPYTDNNASGNPFINNHTFWFAFGCCGKSFCVDDLDGLRVYTDPNYNIGSLYFFDVNVNYETSIWVDFLTQCENCTGNGEPDLGVWHKYEKFYRAGELSNHTSYPSGTFGADLDFMMSVSCDGNSIYGCQSNELD